MKLFTQHVVRGDYWVPTNCSLTVNGGVASLIAWLDHSCQKIEVGGKQGHAPCRKILLQQIPMTRKNIQVAPSPRQLLNGQGVRRISGFRSECHGIRFGTVGTTSLDFCLLIYQMFCLNSFMRSFCSLPLSCVTSPHFNLLC